MDAGSDIDELILRARFGVSGAIARIFEAARGQLLDLAERELPRELRAKVGPSDVVQETAVDMHAGFRQFTGTTTEECYAWLREVLRHNIVDAVRRYRDSQKRDLTREQRLHGSLAHEVLWLPEARPTPDDSAVRREEAALVNASLQRLPPDYQQVLHLRYWRGLSFIEIAAEVGRSPEAARKLWFRAVQRLEKELAARASADHEALR